MKFQDLRREEGANLVEFAFAATILFSMMFGIFQMSMALYVHHYISDAARDACRWAMVRGSTSCTNTPGLTKCGATQADIQNYVKNLGYAGINPAAFTPATVTNWNPDGTACTTAGCNAPGNLVQVAVVYNFPIGIPGWQLTTLTMHSTARMMITQ